MKVFGTILVIGGFMSFPVASFSESFWFRALNSNILYPPNVAVETRIQDQGSIPESISEEQSDLFKVAEIPPSASRYIGIFFRALARQITLFAIGLLVAPFGSIYHGIAALKYAVSKKKDRCFSHGEAFCSDLCLAALSILLVYGVSYHYFYKNNPASSLISICPGALYTVAAWDPKISLRLLFFANRRRGCFDSLALKNSFWIVDQSGNLLSYRDGKRADSKESIDGLFFKIYFSKNQEILQKLREWKNLHPKTPIPFPPTPLNMERLIRKRESTTSHTVWMDEYRSLFRTLRKARKLATERINIKFLPFLTAIVSFKLDIVFFSEQEMNCFLNEKPNPHRSWHAYQESFLRNDLPNEASDNLGKKVLEFVQRLKECKEDPNYALGFLEPINCKDIDRVNCKNIDRVFRKLTLKLHPDKTDSKYHEELFKCLSEAHQRALTPSKVHITGCSHGLRLRQSREGER